jgi:serine/threonine protein kinase
MEVSLDGIEFLKKFDKKKINFSKYIPNATKEAIDLLNKLLQYSPLKRLTAKEALAHPYFEELHDESEELESKSILDFSFEKDASSI